MKKAKHESKGGMGYGQTQQPGYLSQQAQMGYTQGRQSYLQQQEYAETQDYFDTYDEVGYNDLECQEGFAFDIVGENYDSYDGAMELESFIGNNYEDVQWLTYMVKLLLERVYNIEKGNISFDGVGSGTSSSDYKRIDYYKPNITRLSEDELKPIILSDVIGLDESKNDMGIEDYF